MKTKQTRLCHQDLKKFVVELTPPFISAKSWVIADGRTGRLLFSKNESIKREIASLTKIMTAFTALQLANDHDINIYRATARVSEFAANMSGTSALLKEGDILYLVDLFYGMLLPSGNDAAVALAEFFGELIRNTKSKCVTPRNKSLDEKLDKDYECGSVPEGGTEPGPRTLEGEFVEEMNRMAKELNLKDTYFTNSHGMHIFCNISSATDIAKLTRKTMLHPVFCEIVKKKTHTCKVMCSSGGEKEYIWENTNKLLGKEGCNGVKTGMTETAGPCLVTSLQTKEIYCIIVLLNSKSMDLRWQEVKKLKQWAIERLKQIEKTSKNKRYQRKLLKTLQHV